MRIYTTKLLLCLAALSFTSFANTDSYIEFCAGDRYQAKDYGDGNIAGHAFIYVNGLCKDQSKDYPQLKHCDDKDNHEGVGVSLDSSFKNISWIAVPTRELSLFGDYGRNVVDDQTIQTIFEKAKEHRIFENVKTDRSVYPQTILDYTQDQTEQDILFAIGTDIAFNTARTMYCTKTKVTTDQLSSVKTFLNQENDKYYKTDAEYEWSFSDNCTHLIVNALAVAGVNKAKKTKTKRSIVGNIFNLTLPKSELLKLTRKVTKSQYSPKVIWLNKSRRRYFQAHGRLSYGAGNIVSKYPIIKDNDFFKTNGASFFALPVIGMSLRRATSAPYSNEVIHSSKHLSKMEKALRSSFFKKTYKNLKKEQFKNDYKRYLESEIDYILSNESISS